MKTITPITNEMFRRQFKLRLLSKLKGGMKASSAATSTNLTQEEHDDVEDEDLGSTTSSEDDDVVSRTTEIPMAYSPLPKENLQSSDSFFRTSDLSGVSCVSYNDLNELQESVPILPEENGGIPSTGQQTGKRVHFHPGKIPVINTISRHDLTTKEKEKYWYQDSDFENIIRSSQKVIGKMNAGSGNKTWRQKESMSTRGLESMSLVGLRNIAQRVYDVREAVFSEQARQWNQDSNASLDPILIARVSRDATRSCRVHAKCKGAQDQQAASSSM